MEQFLASLTPALRREVEAALEQEDGRVRLTATASRYIDEEGNWPTEPDTAAFLARQFLHVQGQITDANWGSAGLASATVAGLAGGALAIGGGKGAVVMSSNIMAMYWKDALAYSTGMNPIFIRSMKKVFDRVSRGTRWEQLAKDLTAPGGPTNFDIIFGDGLAQIMERELMGIFARSAWRGARSALYHTTGRIGDFSQENAWVQSYVRTFTQNQKNLTQRTVFQVINDALERGAGIRAVTDQLKSMWNLTPTHARAVENYRRGLLRQERSARSVRRLTQQYANKLFNHRLHTMSITEAHTAFNLGREAQWIQAVQNDEMPLDTMKMWVTAMDELVCKICRPLDGQVAPLGHTFEGEIPLLVPAAHPNCRCILVPVRGGAVVDMSQAKDLVFPVTEDIAKHLGGPSGKDPHPSGTPQAIHAGYDAAISELKTGAYDMPMSWLINHIRGSGIRIAQKNRIRALANSLMEKGFTKPITMWVYEDGPFIRDGMHRLEAAHMIGMKRVPVAIKHVKGERPKTDLRGRIAGYRLRRQGLQSRRDTPFKNVKQEEGFVRWFNERMSRRGEQIADEAPPKKKPRFSLFGKSDEAPVPYEIEKHLIGRHDQKKHGRKGHRREEHAAPLSEQLFVIGDKGRRIEEVQRKAWHLGVEQGASPLKRQQLMMQAAKGEYELMRLEEDKRRELSREEKGFIKYHFTENPLVSVATIAVGAGLLRNPNMAREWKRWTERMSGSIRTNSHLSATWKTSFDKRQVTPQLVADVRKMFNGNFGQLSTEVMDIQVTSRNVFTATGRIRTKDGLDVGGWSRSFSRGGEVHHNLLQIEDAFQGTGFAKEFYNQSIKAYRANGFRQVTMLADISVGGYAWAKQGFQFAPGEAAITRAAIATRSFWIRGRHKTYSSRDVFEAQMLSLLPGTKPIDYTKIGRSRSWFDSNGIEHWFGKDLLLGMNWNAVKAL